MGKKSVAFASIVETDEYPSAEACARMVITKLR